MKHIATSFSSAMDAAAPLAMKFDERSTIVMGGAGSLVGRCLDALTFAQEHAPNGIANPGAYAQHIVTRSTEPSPELGYSEFSARISETAQKAGEVVTRELFYIRNTVKPVVDELVARMQDRLSMLQANPLAGIEIKRVNNPAVFAHPSLTASYGRSVDVAVDYSHRNMRLPQLSDNEIIALMKTGVQELDDGIVAHFATLGGGWLETSWKNVYTPVGHSESGNLQSLLAGRGGADTALFIYMTARQMWNNPPSGVDMSAEKFEEAMVHYRDQAAVALCNYLKLLKEDESIGRLIVRNRAGCLEVLEKPYHDFIKKGGDNETLLGFSISGDDFITTEQIMANQAVYKAAWERHQSINKVTFENRLFNAQRDGLLIEYDYMTQTSSEDVFPTSLRAGARKLFVEQVAKLRISDFDNLPMLCMRLICRSRFPLGNAEFVLEGIQRVCDSNKGIGPREAVHIVTIELLAKFYSQFLCKVNPGDVIVRI